MNHNKNTNVSILYNALLQIITEAVIVENKKNAENALIAKNIIKKFFIPGKSLKEYVDISDAIVNSNMINEQKNTAIKYLEEVEKFIKEKKWKNYTNEKVEFLKEIKKCFNLDDLTGRNFPNYKLLASTHLFIESCIGEKSINKLDDKVKICYTLVERLINKDELSKKREELVKFMKENNIDKYTLLLATKEFNNKLKQLKESHRQIISVFINENDSITISNILSSKVRNYISELRQISTNIDDKETSNKISSVILNLEQYKNNIPKDRLEEIAEKLIDVDDLIETLKSTV